MVRQMENHDARIEDNHWDLHELMRSVYYIKEYLQKLVNMNQISHFQDSPARDHPMEETSLMQPIEEPDEMQQK